MVVRFTKGSLVAKSDRLVCIRADGTETAGEMPRQGILPHDAVHFVVESTLGWKDAFFGHIARGGSLDPLEPKRSGKKIEWAQKPQALQAESLVECLQAEQWGGAATPEIFHETLAVTCRRRGVDAPALSTMQLQNVRSALRMFGAAWRSLSPGASLERKF